MDEISEIIEPQLTPETKAKESIVYKVTKCFRLHALDDAHYLKFCMPIPRKDILGQKITTVRIFPKANAFITDPAGNEVAIFYSALLKQGSEFIAGIEYTVELDATVISITPSLISDSYTLSLEPLEQYLNNEADINVQNIAVQKTVQSVIGNLTNPYQKAKVLYDFVVKSIEYDYDLFVAMQTNSDIYKPQKPAELLAHKKGICGDIAKLYVALARASGVPSCIVCGLTFHPQQGNMKSVDNFGHAWAEIYLPTYGWLAVDPTYGISHKDNFFCFNNTDHLTEEYGFANVREFGSLEKGWALQIRTQERMGRYPIETRMEIEIVKLSENSIAQNSETHTSASPFTK